MPQNLAPRSSRNRWLAGGIVVALAAAVAWWQWPAGDRPANVWGAVLALALASTAFAYLIFYRLIARLGATRASGVTYLVPVFGVVGGALLLGEAINAGMLLGAALIAPRVVLLGWQPGKPRP